MQMDSDGTNGYSFRVEKEIAKLAELALAYKWLHLSDERRSARMHRQLSVPLSIFSSITGTSTVLSAFAMWNTLSVVIKITSVLVVISSVMTAYSTIVQFESASKDHHNAAQTFSTIYHDITSTLALPHEMRPNGLLFMAVHRNRMDSEVGCSRSISTHSMERFKREFKDVDMEKPTIIAGVRPVVVVSDSPAPSRLPAVMARRGELHLKVSRSPYPESPHPSSSPCLTGPSAGETELC